MTGMATMELSEDLCYRVLESRDARFDGRFFTGVTSTGVYCRPVCPARTPRRRNCKFYPSAAAASAAGFRPCLRCRPETSPGTPAWLGTSATVTRALRLIHDGALVDGSVEELASRLGIGGRQLRRLFVEHLGATPAAVEQTRRVHFAKKLLDETDLPVTEIVFSAGFQSVRRFNAAMLAAYGRSPRELRKRAERSEVSPVLRLRLGYRPPLDWPQIVGFLAQRAIPGVESVSEEGYARSVDVGDFRGVVRLKPADRDWLVLEAPVGAARYLQRIAGGMRMVFDLGADPAKIAEQLAADRKMARLVRRHPGLRVPGAWDPFELAVRAIVGQQVSVRGATTLCGRIAERYGTKLRKPCGDVDRLFPTPQALASMSVDGAGMPRKRAETIRGLARAVAEDPSLLDGARGLEASVERLCALPGMGPWTAHYIAMRALREPDAFPSTDLGLLKAATNGNGERPTAGELTKMAESWRPWRAYAALHLWQSLGEGE